MAPKKKKEIDQDERFQAIVLTDSFMTRFMPLTSKTPRCLLPLANVPLIEYTLEFLAKAGVNEVYIMCSSHADQIQQYIKNSKWQSDDVDSPFTVTTILSLESKSVGDTMRDLDNRGLITGDFLLISGDIVSNINFDKALEFHKFNKANDKEHILTMCLTNASPYHRTRTQIDSAVFLLDKPTNRCIYYQSIPSSNLPQTSINLDLELLEDIDDEILVRNDLIDCHIDICSPLVPQIFQDNFDYQLLRSDFVKGVLTSDLVKKTIYAYITNEYASRVSSFQNYDAISQDILSRWSYPMVPDSNFNLTSYSYETNHIYKEDKILLAQSCKIRDCVCIGSNSKIDEGSCIHKSTIGRNVIIGKNVRISNSYIWDNVKIDDDCVIENSIIANNCQISTNVRINKCVLGYDVNVSSDKTLNFVRIIDKPIERTNDFEFSDEEDDQAQQSQKVSIRESEDLVGKEGVGHVYISEEESDSEIDEDEKSLHKIGFNFKMLNLSDDSIESVTKKRRKKTRRFSTNSVVSTDFEVLSDEEEEEDFNKEAIDTITRSIENNHDLDTALLELNTLRMSMNVTYHEVRLATVESLIKRVLHFITTKTLEPKDAIIKVFNTWGMLFKRQIFELNDQIDLLFTLQNVTSNLDKAYNQILLFWSIQILYQLDIIEEEMIFKWWESEESVESEKLTNVRGLTEKFIVWLKEAEEESDDE